jgi:hypothetical protein
MPGEAALITVVLGHAGGADKASAGALHGLTLVATCIVTCRHRRLTNLGRFPAGEAMLGMPAEQIELMPALVHVDLGVAVTVS